MTETDQLARVVDPCPWEPKCGPGFCRLEAANGCRCGEESPVRSSKTTHGERQGSVMDDHRTQEPPERMALTTGDRGLLLHSLRTLNADREPHPYEVEYVRADAHRGVVAALEFVRAERDLLLARAHELHGGPAEGCLACEALLHVRGRHDSRTPDESQRGMEAGDGDH